MANHLDDEVFLTREEVAALGRTTVARVRYWERRGLIPRARPAGTRLVLFPRKAVVAWLRGEWDPRSRRAAA